VSSTPNKGKISTDIGDDVIQDALKSVEKKRPAPAADAEPSAEAASPEPAPPNAEVEELKAQLELSQAKGREMMEKIKESHEKMLRALADLDNFKKRAQKEKEEVQKFGVERLLKELLPVADNLDRALEHAKTGADFESFKTGVQMTRKLLEDALGKNGVKAFSSSGKPFDPHLHEAMQQVETGDMPPNHVVSEVLRGYMLNDRLVRPALVTVSKAPAAEAPAGKEEDAAGGEPQA
jgi:molecular chaperone GrpE